MRRSGKVMAACAAALCSTGVCVDSASADTAGSETGTYADYSMMFERKAGQFAPSDGTPYQWSWSPRSETESHISWGEPGNWPPKSAEHFIHDGEWVLLDGWGSDENYYSQRVTQEQLCDVQGNNCTELPSAGGRQHYVRWDVPTEGYQLKATGTITEVNTGKTFDFAHNQTWAPPAPCENVAFGPQTCITQSEAWADNNQLEPGAPVRETLRREIRIAKGLGMAFTIDQQVPQPWHAEATQSWNW